MTRSKRTPWLLPLMIAAIAPPASAQVVDAQAIAPTELEPIVVETRACSAEANAVYEWGAGALRRGDGPSASRLLQRALMLCPSHPFAAELLRVAQTATPAPRTIAPATRRAEADPDAHSTFTHVEFAVGQGLSGAAMAFEVCVLVSCRGSAVAGSLVAGAALGGTLGALFGRRPRQNLALAMNSGAAWGAAIGAMFPAAIFRSASRNNVVIGTLVGQAFGTALGAILADRLDPRAARIATANSAALWVGGAATLFSFAAAPRFNARSFAVTGLLGVSASFALGAGLWRALGSPSRIRMLFVDLSGLLGAAAGAGIGALASRGSRGSAVTTVITASVGAGALAGVIVGFVLTRRVDVRAPSALARAYAAPMGPGDLPGITLGTTF